MAIISLNDRLHITAPVGQNMIRSDLSCETTQDNRRQRFHDSSFLFLFFCFAARNLLIVAKKKNLAEATWPPCNPDRRSLLSERLSRPLVHFLHSMSGCFCFIFLSLGVSHLQPPTPPSTHRPLRTTNLSAPRFQSSADSGDRKSCEFFSIVLLFFFPVGCIYFCLKIPLTSPLLSAGRLGKEGRFVLFLLKKEDIFSHFAELSPLHVDTPVWEAVGAAV